MLHRKVNLAKLLRLAAVAGCGLLPWTACRIADAQPPEMGGEDFGMRILRRLDQDEDGILAPSELEQSSRLREYLERQGVDVNQPVPLSVAAEHQSGMMQEFQSLRGGGEGRGGFGRGGDRGGSDRGGSGDRSSRGGPGSDSREDRRSSRGGRGSSGSVPAATQKGGTAAKVRVGRVGPKLTTPTALPGQYAARDTNRDGQIGLYEWSRTDLSTFRRLDVNGDGFLVPSELANPGSGGSGTTAASTSSVIVSGPTTAGRGSFAATSTPIAAKPAAPAGPPADPKTAAAESAFDYLDREDMSGKKDGVLSAEEFARSRNASKMFAEAKIEIQFPLSKQKFVENYVKLSK